MNERRRSPRFNPEGVEGTLRLTSKAEVLNLSLTGMAIRTSAHLGAGQRCGIRLSDGHRNVRLGTTVVWSKLVALRKRRSSETTPVYEAGLALDEMLSRQAQQFLALLRTSSGAAPETRLSGRFEPPADRPADLLAASRFLVRTISPNGMLVETDAFLDLSAEVTLDLWLARQAITVRARVAYVEELSGRPGKRRMGLEFVDLPEEALNELWKLFASAPRKADPPPSAK